MSTYIKKGDHITARWFGGVAPVALAGMQLKFQATQFVVSGVIKHVRGDHPTSPTQIRLYIDPEDDDSGAPRTRPPGCTCEKDHVAVNPDHVVALTSS